MVCKTKTLLRILNVFNLLSICFKNNIYIYYFIFNYFSYLYDYFF